MFHTIRSSSLFLPVVIVLALGAIAIASENGFVPLFNGNDLSNWEQHGGKAQYSIEGDEIVGTAIPDTPNSFLCTKKEYGDFILHYEFKVDPSLNSGVQIRSHVFDEPKEYPYKKPDGTTDVIKVPAGRVHGYQVEIDPSSRAWTAGIYDEGRRGWLNNLEGDENKEAREAFKQNEWNHVQVVANHGIIKTWLNGVPAADLKDDMTLSGFIALQVHGVGDNQDRVGKQVRWRNIRIKEMK